MTSSAELSKKAAMPDIQPASRILVARLDSIGDCVLSSSFFRGLRRLFPDAEITGALPTTVAPLFVASGLFDRILPLAPNSPEIWAGLLAPPYDVAILPRWDVDYWSTRQLAFLSRAPIRIGFDRGPFFYDQPIDGWAEAYFTDLVRLRSDLHEVRKSEEMLRHLGMIEPIPDPCLQLPPDAMDWAARYLAGREVADFAVLTVAAGARQRVWPIENFLPVIDALDRDARLHCLVVGADDAVEAGAWLQQMRPGVVTCAAGSISMSATAALIARAAIYVGLDTGPMHIAAASRVPVVEISCHPGSGRADHPCSPVRFGPYATPSRVLQPRAQSDMCRDGCSVTNEPHCIRAVAPLDVVEAALRLLAAGDGERPRS
jgi:ADP-heptose:LPS heptosyltransferase